ncbi:hypothetical protein RchiOBHm_Chr4g0431411 [Rosa chinensis]|uniref:Uncharacterized protein n=1 Tax=Rosa chinensis TaxID=74649 RepID=A0A2P6R0P2_ROSCH|nr:hypothetical protein RchiOBHm_Chr4g0431411 [Rosa chinensis]
MPKAIHTQILFLWKISPLVVQQPQSATQTKKSLKQQRASHYLTSKVKCLKQYSTPKFPSCGKSHPCCPVASVCNAD